MNKIPGRAEDFMLPEKKPIIILKTYGGEQIICQLVGDEVTAEDGYLIQNLYTVDDDAIYGKWISGIILDDMGNDPHIYEFPVNQVAALIPEERIHTKLLRDYKERIGLVPKTKFRTIRTQGKLYR